MSADLANQIRELHFHLEDTDIPVDVTQAKSIPISNIETLGASFAPFIASITGTSDPVQALNNLALATDKNGNPIDIHLLHSFKNEAAKLGSYRDASNTLNQVRWREFDPSSLGIGAAQFNPEMALIALALAEINLKLDTIQKTQQEMFEYLKQHDMAELRGNLETLADVLNNYRYHWDNEQYRNNKHVLVQSIRNDAEKAIIFHRAQVKGKLTESGPVHIDQETRDKLNAVRAEFEEYRLSVYLYAFSSFLEALLLRSFDSGYLSDMANEIEDRSNRYRELYTQAYNQLEKEANTTVRAAALGGISAAFGFLGNAIRQTPIGDVTPIDEALIDAGKGVEGFSADVRNEILGSLVGASNTDVRPFIESVSEISTLYNSPMLLLADSDNVYLVEG